MPAGSPISERQILVKEIHLYALQLLAKRDYSVLDLQRKIETKFGEVPDEVIHQLVRKNFLNDRRFADHYVARKKEKGPVVLRDELISHGIAAEIVNEILSCAEWPSLRDALTDKMIGWKLRAPLQSRDAARLFRALLRLGYDEDAIHDEIEQLQQQRKNEQ
jgi:SOS response regulatory protein OraA/RecX